MEFFYFVLNLSDAWNFLPSFLLNLKLHKSSDKECNDENVAKSKSLCVAYTTLMVQIWPASSSPDISLREMAESSLQIDPQNANPFIALVHRLGDECPFEPKNPFDETMVVAARILEIDPTSPYAPYLFSLFLFLYFYCTLRAYKEL